MKKLATTAPSWVIPGGLAVAALVTLVVWFFHGSSLPLALRVPGTDQAPGSEFGTNVNPVLLGKVTRSDGQPASLPGAWPQFRGTNSDGISREAVSLSHNWQPAEPRELWGVDMGEGYAGAAVLNGRVYVMDYDRDKKQDALRCLSLADGREIWRYAYPVSVKRNHGMSRTTPVVTDKLAIAMGPKCHVVCADAVTGELRWGLDLVRQFGTTVPAWYAGQCPLLDKGALILAPGGRNALIIAVDPETGKVLWQTPNPHAWKMTHSSLIPMDLGQERTYVYCADKGVVGVSAKDGRILWETTDWKISIATVASPLVLDGDRIFFSGGYNSGSLMVQIKKESDRYVPRAIFKLAPEIFGATQHTPILHDGHIYGVRPDGKFVCLDLEGKVVWTSDAGQNFGLGPFMLADGVIFALNDNGLLRMIEATPQKYKMLAQAQALKGRESWGPLALAGGRLIARDLTRMVCLDVARR